MVFWVGHFQYGRGMTDVILYGVAPSSYVRTARMTCVEKGISHELVSQNPNSPEQLAVHPFGKMPAMKHGERTFYETSAICRYIDQAFEGPSLVPSDPVEAAIMEQWISVVNSYLYRHLIAKYALKYIFASMRGAEPDRAAIEAGVEKMAAGVKLIDEGYEGKDWLAGGALSLADLFVIPLVSTISMFPEGKEALSGCGNAARMLGAASKRASFAEAHKGLG